MNNLRNLHATLVSMALLLCPPASHAELDATERELAAAVDEIYQSGLELLIRSVNINSGTMNFAGVREVGALLEPEFAALGFEVEWLDGEAWGRAGHLVARHPADAAPKFLLIGHLDTVFEPDSPFQQYTLLSEGVASGPGISDMKGGNVIMLQALRALDAVGALRSMDITVVLTGDEELSGRPLELSKQALVDAAIRADIALGFENGDGSPATANISRRGSIGWTLQVTGTPAHSSQVFREDIGPGAIYEAARILTRFHDELRDEEFLTYNPGRILGGTTIASDDAANAGSAFGKDNVIAEHALVTGDIRAISAEQLERVKERMRSIVADSYPHTSASIDFSEGYPPLAPTQGNRELLNVYSGASEDLGFGPVSAVNPLRAGAADVSFTAAHVEMAIDGLGMSGSEGHTVNETGLLPALSSQARRAALLMYRLSQRD